MCIRFILKSETKTCYRFENQNGGKETQQTLYLKKSTVKEAGIDPRNGLLITIKDGGGEADANT